MYAFRVTFKNYKIIAKQNYNSNFASKLRTMCKFSSETKDKIGNAMIYIAKRTNMLSKTKLIKLLYIMEERMVERHYTPFLAIPYEIWHLGPVQKDLFADLSDQLFLMHNYLEPYNVDSNKFFKARKEFSDDEFSQQEITVMDEVLAEFGNLSAGQLVSYLHREDSLWYKTAQRNGALEWFNNGLCNSTDIKIDFGELIDLEHREAYYDSLAIHTTSNNLNAAYNV